MPESDFDFMEQGFETDVEAVEVSKPSTAEAAFADLDLDEEDPEESMALMTDMFQANASSIDLSKPWMKHHKFTLIKTADEVKVLVDRCIEAGRCALDLETEGFDNRIEYDAQGKPYTVHAIVGYCVGLNTEGYYIPVRHHHDPLDPDPNVDSVPRAEAEITRLCREAQPILVEGCQDLLGAKDSEIATPPRVVIEFWHSKFDQEFLYPITGIDIWHPLSFEDGMLANYVLYTDDDHGLKPNAEKKIPPIKEGDQEHRYEMIKFEDLFLKKKKKNERKFKFLTPRTSGEGWNAVLYGCSDGICTNMLCAILVPQAQGPRFAPMYRLEKQVVQAVRVLERARVLLDKNEVEALLKEAEEELKTYEDRIRAIAVQLGFPEDFNPASAAQLADFLFGTPGLNLPNKPEKTAGGQYKTDESTLEAYYNDHPGAPEVLLMIIKHRQINKVKGTYLENLAHNTDILNQLRLNFKQTGAATGRFTAPKGDPEHGFGGIPIQGIPARDDPKKPKVAHSLRRMFVAREGYVFVKVDYASQELRIAANVSGERKWISEYEKEAETGTPADLHFLTAQAFYPGLTKDDADYKLKRNAGKCVHPDTLVLTQKGLKPFSSLGKFGPPDSFRDAPEDLTLDGNPVKALYNGGVKPLVHVVATRGILTCTPEHRFQMKTGELVRAGDLQPGQLLSGFFADGVNPIEPHWRSLTSAGAYLARHHCYNGAPAKVALLEGRMAFLDSCPNDTPNEVIAVLPAGEGRCLDVTLNTKDHLYRANVLMTHNTANFALVYGGGVGAVQRATGCDKVEGARLKQAFDESVPNFSKWVKKQHAFVKKNKGVKTGFHRFIAIPDALITAEQVMERVRKVCDKKGQPFTMARSQAEMQAKKERAACERKSTNFPIQGSGADILKISLMLLLREFHLRGWLKNGGDDSVRMVMTVHDEIVFEIRKDRVAEAVPVIIKLMEYPSTMAGWKVPLIAEAELGSQDQLGHNAAGQRASARLPRRRRDRSRPPAMGPSKNWYPSPQSQAGPSRKESLRSSAERGPSSKRGPCPEGTSQGSADVHEGRRLHFEDFLRHVRRRV